MKIQIDPLPPLLIALLRLNHSRTRRTGVIRLLVIFRSTVFFRLGTEHESLCANYWARLNRDQARSWIYIKRDGPLKTAAFFGVPRCDISALFWARRWSWRGLRRRFGITLRSRLSF